METFKKKYQDALEVNVTLRSDQENLIDQIKEMEEISSREMAQLVEEIKKMVENEVRYIQPDLHCLMHLDCGCNQPTVIEGSDYSGLFWYLTIDHN